MFTNWRIYSNKFYSNFNASRYCNISSLKLKIDKDQFVVLNSLKKNVYEKSVEELEYQAKLLDLFGLHSSHKLQLHVGGMFGDKDDAKKRFIERYKQLSERIRFYFIF